MSSAISESSLITASNGSRLIVAVASSPVGISGPPFLDPEDRRPGAGPRVAMRGAVPGSHGPEDSPEPTSLEVTIEPQHLAAVWS
jgi:hypothetical protein